MDKTQILDAVKKVKADVDNKRNFSQAIDLAVNLKDIDTNKVPLEEYVVLPHGRGRVAKICALVGAELKTQAEKLCDLTISSDDFEKWADKRKCRKLARSYDFFIGQANIMPLVARSLGRYLGPVGKMPSPKAGHLLPPKANIEPLVKSLRNSVKIMIKKAPVIHCSVGNEKMSDEHIAENILAVVERVKSKMPMAQHNIKNIVIKKTMSSGVKVA
ncbi:MAG: 50S ribosomal protein L1 [archaeon]